MPHGPHQGLSLVCDTLWGSGAQQEHWCRVGAHSSPLWMKKEPFLVFVWGDGPVCACSW